MLRALIPISLTALLAVTLAEPPVDRGGGYGSSGGFTIAKAAGHGMKYAGPIVYTNEKPPIIHFPPPPKGGGMGWGNKGPTSIRYIPMPHHDLPILIYQSDSNPPIHVVSPPKPDYGPSGPKVKYSPPRSSSFRSSSNYDTPSQSISYRTPKSEYGPPPSKHNYGPPKVEYGGPTHMEMESSEWKPGPPPSLGWGQPKSGWGQPKSSYSAPKPKAVPLPHIIYSGHPPIHIFQVLQGQKGQGQKVGSSSGASFAASKLPYGHPRSSYGPLSSFYGSSSRDSQGAPKVGSYPLISSPPSGGIFGPSSYTSSKGGSFGNSISSSPPQGFQLPKGNSFGSSSISSSYSAPTGGSLSSISSSYRPQKNFGSPTSGYSYGPPPPRGGGFLSSMLSSFGPSFAASQSSYGPGRFEYGPPKSSGGWGQGSKSKTKYVIAPKAWHKPPIIIYAGVKPPVHVYEKPEGGYAPSVASSSTHPQPNADAVDITYGNSRMSQTPGILVDTNSNQKSTVLNQQPQQPAMRTIYVSSGAGSRQFKTYLVTNNDPLTIQPLGYTSGPSMSMERSNEISEVTPPKLSSSQTIDTQTSSATSTNIEQAELVHQQPIAQSRSLPVAPDFQNDVDLKVTTSRTDNGGDSVEVLPSVPSVELIPSEESVPPQVDIELSSLENHSSSKSSGSNEASETHTVER